MTPLEIIAAVAALINVAKGLVDMGKQIHGESAIPSWDQILLDNAATQAKIDAEKV